MSKQSRNESQIPNDEAMDSVVEEFGLEEGVETPEQIVDLLEQQVAQFRDRELKAQAELENFRKRVLRDTEQQLKYASIDMVRDLLDVVDNLQRAIDAANKGGEASGLTEGVQMVQQQLEGVLAKHHCTPIRALGQPFDPNIHQAIAQQPSREYPAGTVMMETSIGYVLHDRVIRPSMVIVSTGAGA